MQTIYNVDYLKSISKDKLWSLAKQNPNFNVELMEKELKMPIDSAYKTIKRVSSKYDEKVREYIIKFLVDNKNDKDEPLNRLYFEMLALEHLPIRDLYEEAKKYATFNFEDVAKATGLSYNYINSTVNSSSYSCYKDKRVDAIKKYLINLIVNADEKSRSLLEIFNDSNIYKSRKEQEQMNNELNLEELFDKVNNFQKLTKKQIAEDLNCAQSAVVNSITGLSKGRVAHLVKEYLENIIIEQEQLYGAEFLKEFNLDELFKEANKYQKVTKKQIAEDLNCKADTVSSSIRGQSRGETAYRIKEYLENIINQYKPLSETNQKMQEQDLAQEEAKEQETMTEETFTEDKEMKTYDNFLNFIDIQKELPIVKKALEETLKENQNLDKILAKEEFITIETAQELNEKLFANEYTEEEILDFENQYFGTTDNASLKDKIKSFVEKHNLSLETALKLLQISEEDYKKMLEGADKVSNKTADKIYKAISAFDEFYRSEKTQDTINNTKNTFVTGFAIASAKSQTFLNKGLNKFADFLNKSADKIKNSNSENKED